MDPYDSYYVGSIRCAVFCFLRVSKGKRDEELRKKHRKALSAPRSPGAVHAQSHEGLGGRMRSGQNNDTEDNGMFERIDCFTILWGIRKITHL